MWTPFWTPFGPMSASLSSPKASQELTWVLLRAPTEASVASFNALWHPQGVTARPPVTFYSFSGPICCPWGLFLGPPGTNLLAFNMVSLPTLRCIQSRFQAYIHSALIAVRTPCDMFALGFSFRPS